MKFNKGGTTMQDKHLLVLRGVIQNIFTKRILLIKRSEQENWNPGKWEFPGGKADDWLLLRDIGREILEEIGMQKVWFGKIKIFNMEAEECQLAKYKGRKIVTLIILGRTIFRKIKLSQEHDDYRWVKKLSDVRNLDLKEGVYEILEKVL